MRIDKEKSVKPITAGASVDTSSSHPGVIAVLKSGDVEAKYLDIIAVSPRRAGEVRGASPRRHW